MKQKLLTLAFIALFSSIVSFAQTSDQKKGKYTISGKVIDKVSSKSIDYASVALYKNGADKAETGVITDNKGNFSLLNLLNGNYYLKIEFMGYESKKVEFTILNSNVFLEEPIILNINSVMLGAVTVTGKAEEKQITVEKTKIDLSKSTASTTGSITEILKSQPAVTIDNDNNIFLRGNKNISIMIDGRPTTLTALSAIPVKKKKR